MNEKLSGARQVPEAHSRPSVIENTANVLKETASSLGKKKPETFRNFQDVRSSYPTAVEKSARSHSTSKDQARKRVPSRKVSLSFDRDLTNLSTSDVKDRSIYDDFAVENKADVKVKSVSPLLHKHEYPLRSDSSVSNKDAREKSYSKPPLQPSASLNANFKDTVHVPAPKYSQASDLSSDDDIIADYSFSSRRSSNDKEKNGHHVLTESNDSSVDSHSSGGRVKERYLKLKSLYEKVAGTKVAY